MSDLIGRLLLQIRTRKTQILFSVISFFAFMVLLFPFDDLTDILTAQISKATQNQVFVSFSSLGVQFLPPGVKMTKVMVDSSYTPQVKLESLSLAPSLSGLLTFRPGFSAQADGLLGGELSVSVKAGEKIGEDLRSQNVDLLIEDLQLKDLVKISRSPIEVFGTGDIRMSGDFDPTLGRQPDANYKIDLKDLKIPAGTVPTMMGPISLPSLGLKNLNLKGRLVNGELIIEESTIGQAGDSISGKVKGKLDLRFSSQSGGVQPTLGAYDLKLDLSLNREAESQIGVFLSIFDKYRTLTGTGARYALQVSGSSFQALPKMQAITSF